MGNGLDGTQVAAYAQHHLCVRKHQAADGRMHTSIMPLLTEVIPHSSGLPPLLKLCAVSFFKYVLVQLCNGAIALVESWHHDMIHATRLTQHVPHPEIARLIAVNNALVIASAPHRKVTHVASGLAG